MYKHTLIQVNENGVISFENPWRYAYPNQFPTDSFFVRQAFGVAPFWSDNDIRREGRVRYYSYSCNADLFGLCQDPQEGRDALASVNDYINQVIDEEDDRFDGKWLLIAHWQNVHPSPHGDENPNPGIPAEELNKVSYFFVLFGMVKLIGRTSRVLPYDLTGSALF